VGEDGEVGLSGCPVSGPTAEYQRRALQAPERSGPARPSAGGAALPALRSTVHGRRFRLWRPRDTCRANRFAVMAARNRGRSSRGGQLALPGTHATLEFPSRYY